MSPNNLNLDGTAVLLVSNDDAEARQIRAILSTRDCQVHDTGPQLNADSLNQSFDAGIVALPQTSGWAAGVIVALRSAPLACAAVTVLDLGARSEITDSLRYGAVDCILRPFTPAELFERIGHAVATTHRWRARLAASHPPVAPTARSLEQARRHVFEPIGQAAPAPTSKGDQRAERMVERLAHEHRLTRREREVLYWLVQGHRYDDIATMLGVVPRTAKFHAANLLRKLELDSRHELPRLLILEA